MKKSAQVTIYMGRKDSGKSYSAKRQAEAHGGPVSVWDPRWEWAGPKGKDVPRMRRLVVRSMSSFKERQLKTKGPLAPLVAFQLDESEFDKWASWILSAGNQLVVIDEAHNVAPPEFLPPQFKRLVTQCRHVNADLLLCCLRPTAIHPSVRSQADTLRVWKMGDPIDWAWIKKACGSDFAKKVQALGPRKYCEISA